MVAKKKKDSKKGKGGIKRDKRRVNDLSWGETPIDSNKLLKHANLCSFIASDDIPRQQRQAVLQTLNSDQVGGLGEVMRSVLFQPSPKIKLTPEGRKKFRQHKNFLLSVANPKTKFKCKKESLIKRGGILPFLLKAAAPLFRKIAFPLVGKVLTKLLK